MQSHPQPGRWWVEEVRVKKGFEGGEQLAAVFGIVNFLFIKHNFSM